MNHLQSLNVLLLLHGNPIIIFNREQSRYLAEFSVSSVQLNIELGEARNSAIVSIRLWAKRSHNKGIAISHRFLSSY